MSETTEAPATELNDRADIRSSLESAFADYEARDAAPKPDAPVVEPKADAPKAEAKPEPGTDTRARDEHGRFVRTAAEEAQDAETNAAEGKPPADKTVDPQTGAPKEGEEAPAATPKGVEAPPNMTAAEKEAFAKAPPEVQEWAARRHREQEAHFTRQTQAIARWKRDYEPVAQMLDPHMDTIRAKGFTPASLINAWYSVEKKLADGQGLDVVRDLVRAYRMDPSQVAQAIGYNGAANGAPPQGHNGGPPLDGAPPPPEPHAGYATLPPELTQTMAGMIQWINDKEAQDAQQRQAAQQQEAQRLIADVNKFAQEKDATGALLRPYFDEVKAEMADLVETAHRKGGDIPPLSDLYDSAVMVNPITRARVLDQRTAAHEAQRQADDRKRAEEARAKAAKSQRASAPVRGAPGTGHVDPRANGELTRAQQLEEAYAEATAR